MSPTISSLFIECMQRFSELLVSGHLMQYDTEVPKGLWEDELGRLRVWASNIGAHQTGQSSLDFRLRDASHIKKQTVRLLQALQRILGNLEEVLAEPTPVDNSDSDSDDGDEDGTEIQQIYKAFVDVVNSLFQISMLIRRPARHDQILGTKRADAAGFEPFDQQHVSNKYPRLEQKVIERLGVGISRRRAILKYRERHHAKMKKGIRQIAGDQSDSATNNLSDTVATEYVEEEPVFEDTLSQSGISQTSYAQTLLSDQNAMTIPPPPKESVNESPFECPYCYFIITIKNRRSWARHIFRDIMPYICVFQDCPTPNKLYSSRRDWFHHLQVAHSVSTTSQTCPLCREIITAGSLFQKHLGRHLEELALFAMPRNAQDENEPNSIASDRVNTRMKHINEHINGTSDDDDDDGDDLKYVVDDGGNDQDTKNFGLHSSDNILTTSGAQDDLSHSPIPDHGRHAFDFDALWEDKQFNDDLWLQTPATKNEILPETHGQPDTSSSSDKRRKVKKPTLSDHMQQRNDKIDDRMKSMSSYPNEHEKGLEGAEQLKTEHQKHEYEPSGPRFLSESLSPLQTMMAFSERTIPLSLANHDRISASSADEMTSPERTIPLSQATQDTPDHKVMQDSDNPSASWTLLDDETLLRARIQGDGRNQIRHEFFPDKSVNICRERFERFPTPPSTATQLTSYHRVMQDRDNSSAPWTPQDDEILLQARAQGYGWNQIQREHFPNKSANASRKRYERLAAKRRQSDWNDGTVDSEDKAVPKNESDYSEDERIAIPNLLE